MKKTKIILTDSNTLKQIRPLEAEISYKRYTGNEIKTLFEELLKKEHEGELEIENKLKRDGYCYGLFLLTGEWYPPAELVGDTIIDVPYNTVAINISTSNPSRHDFNDRSNWDKGLFDLEARVISVKPLQKDLSFEDLFGL